MKAKTILYVIVALTLVSCSKEEALVDHEKKQVFFPLHGLSINTAWDVEGGEYISKLQVYCSGLVKGASSDIAVRYAVDPALVTEYNNDITQQYSGMIEALPADCYKMESNTVIIPKGEVSGNLPIKILVNKILEKGLSLGEFKYVIPLRLESTSMGELHETPGMGASLFGVVIEKPGFYFWVNRTESAPVGIREVYSEKAKKHTFIVKAEGVPSDISYDLHIDVAPDYLKTSQTLLPRNAYKIESETITIQKGKTTAELPVSIISSNIEFLKTYYLPVRIASSSKYSPLPEKNVLLLKVEVKNDYEWPYVSKLSIKDTKSGRNMSYQVNKAPSSVSKDILELQMITNGTIAGRAFNDKYYKLKIIPTNDKNKWGVELIKITDAGYYNSPSSLELHPDHESFYDWDNEKFHLYYRFKQSEGYYIEVEEILEAQF